MSDLVVLALDIAKWRTGWAVGYPGMNRPSWGVHQLAGEWDRYEGKRLHDWRCFLERKIDEHRVTYVAMERPFIDMKNFDYNGTAPILQMHGILLELAHARGIKVGAVAIQSWRSHFLGLTAAPKHLAQKERTPWLKDQAMKRAAERGWLPEFHDEAEALGIMDFALACKDADYDHKVGPVVRRTELRAEVARFRGEAPR
jgi:hypothetical protein